MRDATAKTATELGLIAAGELALGAMGMPPGSGSYLSPFSHLVIGSNRNRKRGRDSIPLDPYRHLKMKCEQDFYLSFLNSVSAFKEGCRIFSQVTFDIGNRFPTKRKLKEYADPDDKEWVIAKIGKVQQNLRQFYASQNSGKYDDYPEYFDEYIERINEFCRKRERNILVSCESIEPSTIAVMRSLKHGLVSKSGVRRPLHIDLSWRETSGVYQTEMVGANTRAHNPFDFILSATGAFNLTGIVKEGLSEYRCAFPIHSEVQVRLVKPNRLGKLRASLRRSRKRFHIFSDSSAEEELLLNKRMYGNPELVSHDRFENLFDVIDDMRAGDEMSAWEPLANYLISQGKAKWVGDPHFHTISFFQHTDWSMHGIKRASASKKEAYEVGMMFKELFLFKWNQFTSHYDAAFFYLSNDQELLSCFKAGSGHATMPKEKVREALGVR
ncbi:MAG: hypothetical protein MRY64_03850 [Hyphomonadaceae bacterium]|nr:hypothetical protein [Hyphomonadaceae bacterium]